MSAESDQKCPFFPVNVSPTPPASSTLDPSLLNQLNGVSCYLPLVSDGFPSSPRTLWRTCPTCDLPFFFVFHLSASTPQPLPLSAPVSDGPRILQILTCGNNCAADAIIQAEASDAPTWQNEWRDERVIRLLCGPGLSLRRRSPRGGS